MKELTIIFPHQLFYDQPAIEKERKVILVEHPHFFTKFPFHKQKLIYHRATLQNYKERLIANGYKVEYVEYHEYQSFKNKLADFDLYIVDPIEHDLKNEILSLKKNCSIHIFDSPMFLTPKEFIKEHFEGKSHHSMQSFYILQRRRMNLLMENGKPTGGKWSYDQENRRSIPKQHTLPHLRLEKPNSYTEEAISYIKHHFSNNPGHIDCYLPIDYESSIRWLDDFLEDRLESFGEYEDAIIPHESFLYHSILSPMLNIGLITPKEVIEKTLSFAKKNKTPLNSLEGFIRQIIGWREFMKMTYDLSGEKMRKSNFFHHNKSIPKSYWDATTTISPIDGTILKILQFSYCHHIERLMILGNFMLLNQFSPNEIYNWFMALFIDAYDWVMVPNIYAMSQYADGGLMTTKPYISSSNYLLKMSHYGKGAWTEIWDSLYWNFIYAHKKSFSSNPRMSMMVKIWDKMDKKKQDHYLKRAKDYLEALE